jgi:hypothetical protein
MKLVLVLAVGTFVGCTNPIVPAPNRGSGGSAGSPSIGDTKGSATGATAGRAAGDTSDEQPSRTAPGSDDDSLASDAGVDSDDAPEQPDAGARDAGPGKADAAPADAAPAMPPDGSSPTQDTSVIGTWQGQVEDSIRRQSTICMVVTTDSEPGLAGEMTYMGTYNCRANIEFDHADGDTYWYTQDVLTMSRMCPAGRLRVERKLDGNLDLQSFFGPGEVPDENGTLMPVESCP